MMKKKIIHFIFNLGRGGAETMIVRLIKELPEYEHVVVTLFSLNHFGKELTCDKLICLNLNSLLSLPLAVIKFRRLINEQKPDIVHTHLFWPTVIARTCVPQRIPLITTIHAFIANSVEYKHWHIRFLDKLTYRLRKTIIIVVAKGALHEYFSFLRIRPFKAYALYTFVDTDRFNSDKIKPADSSPVFRVVSVGALRKQKNHSYLIKAFAALKDHAIELHIYGTGNLEQPLKEEIQKTGAKVVLKGEVRNIELILSQYDLYIMASSFEGFSLSVLEAMAMGMPLLLSDINSFEEQCGESAFYFSLNDPVDINNKLLEISRMSKPELKLVGEAGRQKAISNYTLTHHIEGLRKIYTAALLSNN